MSFLKTVIAVLAVAFAGSAVGTGAEPVVAAAEQSVIQRGEYLVTVGGCHDCHTPKVFSQEGPQLDTGRLLSGHPEGSRLPAIVESEIKPDGWMLFNNHLTVGVGPWGITFAANLTADEETGIGRWTEEAFVASMRTGLHWGVGPPIMPPMPWPNLAKATDEDLHAIFAYLKSTRPVKNRVPAAMSLQEYKASLENR